LLDVLICLTIDFGEISLTSLGLLSIFNIVIILERTQRKELAKALYDVGKLVFAALVIGQFVSGVEFRLSVFIAGLMFFMATFIIATMLNKGVE
jgi:hypothetical protein